MKVKGFPPPYNLCANIDYDERYRYISGNMWTDRELKYSTIYLYFLFILSFRRGNPQLLSQTVRTLSAYDPLYFIFYTYST